MATAAMIPPRTIAGLLQWILSLLLLLCATSRVPAWSPSASSNTFTRKQHPQQKQPHIIVVGGGVGGLATAARICSSKNHYNVTVLEKNPQVGGRCGSFQVETTKGTFRHERGPSLLLLKDVYLQLFQDCSGRPASDYGLELTQCTPAYQVVFEDGDRIELGFPDGVMGTKAAELKSRSLMNAYEPNGAEKWDVYMRACTAFLDCGLPNFIEERLDVGSFPAFLYESLKDSAKAWPLKPHSSVLNAIFESTKMKALASFQNLYVGLEPYANPGQFAGGIFRKTAPAVFGLLSAIELHPSNKYGGVFAPIGGFDAVTVALARLAIEKGVQIQCDSTVTKVSNDGVTIVSSSSSGTRESTFMPADLVLVNADLPFATKTLLNSQEKSAEPKYDWDDRFDYSSGVIAFHWSIDKELHDLNTHNVFLVAENDRVAEASWRVLRNPPTADATAVEAKEPFNFYVHRASKSDPTAAPEGCDAIMVLVPCQTLVHDSTLANLPRDEAIEMYKRQFGKEVIDETRTAVLKRLAAVESLQALEEHILDEVMDTPGTYADHYNVAAGTPFALSHGLGQLSLTRPDAHHNDNDNIMFVGASSRPGNGVPLVLIGSKLVAEKALKKLSQKSTHHHDDEKTF